MACGFGLTADDDALVSARAAPVSSREAPAPVSSTETLRELISASFLVVRMAANTKLIRLCDRGVWLHRYCAGCRYTAVTRVSYG